MHPVQQRQNLTLFRDTDVILRFRLTRPSDVSAWETKFIVRDRSNTAVSFEYTGVISEDVPNAATIGVIDVELSEANTHEWSTKTYAWTFERVTPGSKSVLAFGELKVIGKV